jgi:hypothetical protein
MTKAKVKSSNKVQHLVANNPEYDRRTKDPNEIAADRKAIRDTLYDASSYRTHAGHWKRRDEPGEPRKTEYLTIAPDALKRQKQWDARQRLKKKQGGVPIRKDGRKLFDEFMKEANAKSQSRLQPIKKTRDLSDLRNAYNAASSLDFDGWVVFMNDLFKGQI